MSDFLSLAAPGVRQLHPYQPGKPIEELERELGITDIIKLASNENPLGPSPKALAAMRATMDEIWLYPDGSGYKLKARIAALHGINTNQITLGNGSSEPLELVVRAFVQPGDEVLFSEHSFAIYPILTQAVGGVGVAAPARDWGYDLEALKGRIGARTRVIFVANPNNPTGTWLGGEALKEFIAKVPPEVIVVVDEAYYDYASHPATGAADYPDCSKWLGEFPNLVVTRTFSKAQGLAGLRVGYALAHPQVTDLLNRLRPPFNVNSLAMAAAEAALDDAEHLARTVAVNAAGLRQLEQGFAQLGLPYIPSVGNFISVELKGPALPVYEALLREGVIVRPVANYGMPNHLRVTVGTEQQNARFISALGKVLGAV